MFLRGHGDITFTLHGFSRELFFKEDIVYALQVIFDVHASKGTPCTLVIAVLVI